MKCEIIVLYCNQQNLFKTSILNVLVHYLNENLQLFLMSIKTNECTR